jgi:hypothetical protein
VGKPVSIGTGDVKLRMGSRPAQTPDPADD